MDGTRKYHSKWGYPITKERIWYALTDKWILAQKLRIPKIQFPHHMKSRRRKTKVWVLQSFLEGGTKYSREQIWRQSVEQILKERPSRDCATWGSIPYSVIKPRHYCGCQQVLVDRSLDMAVSWEALPEPDKYRGGCSQPSIELIMGSPMKELEKGPKKLKGFATP